MELNSKEVDEEERQTRIQELMLELSGLESKDYIIHLRRMEIEDELEKLGVRL